MRVDRASRPLPSACPLPVTKLGFDLLPGEHAIVPVMLYDAKTAKSFADEMLKEGVYVVAFSYPVVGKGRARIRTQMSAIIFLRQDVTSMSFGVEMPSRHRPDRDLCRPDIYQRLAPTIINSILTLFQFGMAISVIACHPRSAL